MSVGTYRPMTLAQVRQWRDQLDAAGHKLVLTNGCFDLIHPGHVRYLLEARALGDVLVVGLNSDASVRELKGPTRPVTRQKDRAEVLAALRPVDGVVIFDELRATNLIREIRPHVYAKGGDYTVDSLNPEEREALDEVGAKIEILPLVAGRSTTDTLRRLQGELGPQTTLRIAVLGSGAGSNFRAILKAIDKEELDAEVAVAISDVAGSGFLQHAKDWAVPAIHVDSGDGGRGSLSEAAVKEIGDHLKRADVDVVVLTGFMRILREPLLSEYRDRIVNVHPSLLPKFKGANAPQLAIDEGEIESGCTVHLVTEEIDGGRILAQATVPVILGDTAAELHARIKVEEHKLLPRVLAEWESRGLPKRGSSGA